MHAFKIYIYIYIYWGEWIRQMNLNFVDNVKLTCLLEIDGISLGQSHWSGSNYNFHIIEFTNCGFTWKEDMPVWLKLLLSDELGQTSLLFPQLPEAETIPICNSQVKCSDI